MATPLKANFKIYQGSTFHEVIRWESSFKRYVPITAIFNTAPLTVVAPDHDLIVGWRAKISNVAGMTEVNALDYQVVSAVTTSSVIFNEINPVGFKPYVSGGILEYNIPIDLEGFIGRMQIRPKLTSTEIIDELTSEDGGIFIDDAAKTITVNISASDTMLYNFKSAVYSIEMEKGNTVTTLLQGNITLEKEVTR